MALRLQLPGDVDRLPEAAAAPGVDRVADRVQVRNRQDHRGVADRDGRPAPSGWDRRRLAAMNLLAAEVGLPCRPPRGVDVTAQRMTLRRTAVTAPATTPRDLAMLESLGGDFAARPAAEPSEAAVAKDALGGVVPCGGHHTAAGMRAGAAQVEAVNGRGVLGQIRRGAHERHLVEALLPLEDVAALKPKIRSMSGGARTSRSRIAPGTFGA